MYEHSKGAKGIQHSSITHRVLASFCYIFTAVGSGTLWANSLGDQLLPGAARPTVVAAGAGGIRRSGRSVAATGLGQ